MDGCNEARLEGVVVLKNSVDHCRERGIETVCSDGCAHLLQDDTLGCARGRRGERSSGNLTDTLLQRTDRGGWLGLADALGLLLLLAFVQLCGGGLGLRLDQRLLSRRGSAALLLDHLLQSLGAHVVVHTRELQLLEDVGSTDCWLGWLDWHFHSLSHFMSCHTNK